MKNKKGFIFIIIFTLCFGQVFSQRLTREEINDTIEKMPTFSIHKDNYFITGISTDKEINSKTADAKYQISFKALLIRDKLPFDTHMFLTYTQKAFWSVYQFSSPFRELNFNPGIGLGKPIFNKKDQLAGMAYLQLEHESNGRDSIYSRSWNSLSLSYHTAINENLLISAKAWLPIRYKKDNPDLIDFLGYGKINLTYNIIPNELLVDIMLRKGMKDWHGTLRTRLLYKPFISSNVYLMLEWFKGNTESLINFKENRSMVRAGFVIKSDELNFLKTIPDSF
ncbi:phospholipase A1 [Salegentibacter sp. 24]|jgi:phospholipase A1|uniref:phospholipase A n=1 Tax=Salegentibacter sp. 24 TaxID=2183986 RepID=UPI00105BB40C|nr:phospholipase A [Salegentibacter sp. 24]TDN88085.1 phospholipase A1 [Salegentibacter sp. 24]